jgi:hypothetical protein
MSNTDDFRFHAHELIVDLDAATTEMMKLISSASTERPGVGAGHAMAA